MLTGDIVSLLGYPHPRCWLTAAQRLLAKAAILDVGDVVQCALPAHVSVYLSSSLSLVRGSVMYLALSP